MGSPSNNQTILAAGNEPHDSQRSGAICPARRSWFGVVILIQTGFTYQIFANRLQRYSETHIYALRPYLRYI